ncbi:MAG: UDP-N-acetylmuramoyl-tripeptide--D-alanyl-D-alanine ligase [Thermoflexales bacterium]
MTTLTLADLVEGLYGVPAPHLANRPVREVVIDSRQAQAGDVFVALPGENTDGHLFVADALQRGAIAAIIARPEAAAIGDQPVVRVDSSHPPPDTATALLLQVPDTLHALQQLGAFWRARAAGPNLRVIGVTGSVGKTTTKEYIAQVLSSRYRVLKSAGNQNNEIGIPLTLLRLRPEHERLVLEMGMYAIGEIAAYCAWAKPHVGVVTMVAAVHLERLGSIEAIAQAKSELIAALPPADAGGVAILNDDDLRVRDMAALTRARVVTYGLTPRADVWAEDVESLGLSGIQLTLHHGRSTCHARLPLLGRHSVHTVLRAAATGLVEGLSLEEVVEALCQPHEQLRLMVARGPYGSIVLDDTYNASRESTLAALNLLAELSEEGLRIAVLGDMLELGELEQQVHKEVGCRAASAAEYVVGVGARARWICQAAVACGAEPSHTFAVDTTEEALATLQRIVTQKCVILVKGSRGMHMERIVDELCGAAGPAPPLQHVGDQ